MKVYIIWHVYEAFHEGCDEQYLCGIFSSREKAEEIVNVLHAKHDPDYFSHDDYEIEELVIDTFDKDV